MSARQRPRRIFWTFFTLSRRLKSYRKTCDTSRLHNRPVCDGCLKRSERKRENRKKRRNNFVRNKMHKTSCTFSSRRKWKTYLTESLQETRRKHTRNIYYYINIYEIIASIYLAVMRMLHCLSVCSIQIQMYYCIRWSIIY